MNKRKFFLILLFLIPAFLLHAFSMPETSITHTHLMKDIEKSSVTIGMGVEFYSEEPEPYYGGDLLYGYLGYAPQDWLELGIAIHMANMTGLPAGEVKVDVIDIFTDARRLSCLLIGGIGGFTDDDDSFRLVYHGGVTANLRVSSKSQLHVGASADSFSNALSIQGGGYVAPLEWLGVSMNLKFVIGSRGVEPMLSVAPLGIIRL